jgi:hypothetical protein
MLSSATFLFVGLLASPVVGAGDSGLQDLRTSDFGVRGGALAPLVRGGGPLSAKKLDELQAEGEVTAVHRSDPQYLALDLAEGPTVERLELFYDEGGRRLLAVHGLLSTIRFEDAWRAEGLESAPFELVQSSTPPRLTPLGAAWSTEREDVYVTSWEGIEPGVLWVFDDARFWPLCGDPAPLDDLHERIETAITAGEIDEAVRLGQLAQGLDWNLTELQRWMGEQVFAAELRDLTARIEATDEFWELLGLAPELARYAHLVTAVSGDNYYFDKALFGLYEQRIEQELRAREADSGPATFAAWVLFGNAVLRSMDVWRSSSYLKNDAAEAAKARMGALIEGWLPSVDEGAKHYVSNTVYLSGVFLDGIGGRRFATFKDFLPAIHAPTPSPEGQRADIRLIAEDEPVISLVSSQDTRTEVEEWESTSRDTSARDGWVQRYNEIQFGCDDEVEALEAELMAIDTSGATVRSVGPVTAKDSINADGTTTRTYEQEGIEWGRAPDNTAALRNNAEVEARISEVRARCEREVDALGPSPDGTVTQVHRREDRITTTTWRGSVSRSVTLAYGAETRRITETVNIREDDESGRLQKQAIIDGASAELDSVLKKRTAGLSGAWTLEQMEAYVADLEARGEREEATFTRWILGQIEDESVLPEPFRGVIDDDPIGARSPYWAPVPEPTELLPDAPISRFRAAAGG